MFVKICGIRDLETARVAVNAGADAIGFVHHPASPRHIEAAGIRAIVEGVPGVETVLVVRRLPVDKVLALAREGGVSTVQFHGNEGDEDLQRAMDAGLQVVRALSLAEYAAVAPSFGARLLLDAPDPGHGQLIDVEKFTQKPDGPWILAGGLSVENVQAQIQALAPSGVDVSSGVESARGVKDHARIVQFITNARASA